MDGTQQGGFWAGRRVCVTGGTGLLGYRIAVKWLPFLKYRRRIAEPGAAGSK